LSSLVITPKLADAAACCDEWAAALAVACALHDGKLNKGPAIEPSSVYAVVDAFRQRCNDLLDVCECMQHFGRREGVTVAALPCVRGSLLPELQQGFDTIASQFSAELAVLR